MPKTYRDTDDPRQALRDLLAFSSRDWGAVKGDAWLWGIVFGWDCDDDENAGDAMTEVAALHGWDQYDIARLRRLHANFERLTLESPDSGPTGQETVMRGIVCYAKCWACDFGEHDQCAGVWADDEDIDHAKATGQDWEAIQAQPCGCHCRAEPPGSEQGGHP